MHKLWEKATAKYA